MLSGEVVLRIEAVSGCKTYQMIQQLVAQRSDHFEGLLGCHRIHQHVAVNANEVLARHDTVLILCATMSVLALCNDSNLDP